MTEPIVVTAVFTPLEGQRDRLVEALHAPISAVHEEPGCILYAIHDAPDGTIVMIEKWESAELLDQHGAGAAVAQLGRSIEGLVAGPAVVTRLIPIPVGSAEKGAL